MVGFPYFPASFLLKSPIAKGEVRERVGAEIFPALEQCIQPAHLAPFNCSGALDEDKIFVKFAVSISPPMNIWSIAE